MQTEREESTLCLWWQCSRVSDKESTETWLSCCQSHRGHRPLPLWPGSHTACSLSYHCTNEEWGNNAIILTPTFSVQLNWHYSGFSLGIIHYLSEAPHIYSVNSLLLKFVGNVCCRDFPALFISRLPLPAPGYNKIHAVITIGAQGSVSSPTWRHQHMVTRSYPGQVTQNCIA